MTLKDIAWLREKAIEVGGCLTEVEASSDNYESMYRSLQRIVLNPKPEIQPEFIYMGVTVRLAGTPRR